MTNLDSAVGTPSPTLQKQGLLTRTANPTAILRSETQSGLPLKLADGRPVMPAPSGARAFTFAAKRVLDFVGALIAIALLAGPLALVALAIRLTSPGPVLFRQLRHGKDGHPIGVLKFRTLFDEHSDAAGTTQTIPGDARITPIGKVLRRTSVDELPQLFNILMGEMSFVGPRPHPIGMHSAGMIYEQLVPDYALRHAVRPGLTGWAQANGYRGPTTDRDRAIARIHHDFAYIQNASLWLDAKIVLMTIRHEFFTGSGK